MVLKLCWTEADGKSVVKIGIFIEYHFYLQVNYIKNRGIIRDKFIIRLFKMVYKACCRITRQNI